MTMKVIGGAARGRKLKVPKGLTVRPTAARVKESLFNILPHDFSGLRVLDLFAGSGNVSIEALSRGAVEAVLVDESARSAAAIRENLTRLELNRRAQVWVAPVARSLRKLDKAGEKFDLIFLDPPYDKGLVTTTLEAIGKSSLLNPAGGIVVVEHSGRETIKPNYGDLILNDRRRYGDTFLSFFQKEEAENSTAKDKHNG
jgi:16S rRNA (guanine966-N2)-methyltransferase